MPGPLAKRVEERRRRNAVPGETIVEMHGPVVIPEPRTNWHPVAAAWFEALKASGQSLFYEPSDWANAMYACELMTRSLEDEATAAKATAALAAMKDLAPTETDRRKIRLQVNRILGVVEDDARPTALDEYRKVLGG